MISSYIISILAGLTTELGKNLLEIVFNEGDDFININKAYESALKKWTKNDEIIESEKIYIKRRVRFIVKKALGEKIALNENEKELLLCFEKEIQSQESLTQFILRKQNTKIIEQLYSFGSVLELIKRNNLALTADFREFSLQWSKANKQWISLNHESLDILKDIQKKLNKDIIPWTKQLESWCHKAQDNLHYISKKQLQSRLLYDVEIKELSGEFKSFLREEKWHLKVADLRYSIKNKIEEFSDKSLNALFKKFKLDLCNIDLRGNYEIIASKIETLCSVEFLRLLSEKLDSFKVTGNQDDFDLGINIHREIRELKKLPQQSYNKCFNIIGSSGSGKTHFVTSYLSKYSKELNILPIYIKVSLNRKPIIDQITQKLNELLNFSFETKEVFEHLQSSPLHRYRIIIIVDSIENISRENFHLLLETIERKTQYANIYWVMLVNYGAFSKTVSHHNSEILDAYSFKNTFSESIKSGLSQIGSWYNMDYFNDLGKVPANIILNKIPSKYYTDEIETIIKKSIANNDLGTPYFSWLICEFYSKWNEFNEDTIDIISLIGKMENDLIRNHSIDNDLKIDETRCFIDLVNRISDIVVDRYCTHFSDDVDLKKSICSIDGTCMDLNKVEVLSAMLDSLYKLNLLYTPHSNLSFEECDTIIQLNNNTFWSYRIANHIYNHNIFQIKEVSESDFANDDLFWSRVYEFILIIHLSKLDDDRLFECEVVDIFNSDLPKKIIWFSISKLKPKTISKLYKVITKKHITLSNSMDDLVAMLLHFNKFHHYELPPTKKISIINNYIADIKKDTINRLKSGY